MACGQVLIEAACTVWPQPPCAVDLLLAMPMHPHRLQQRGFNHAQQFATQLARHWQIPCIRDGVLRIRDSGPQAGLSKRARTRSLRGAFACTQSWQGLHVMLVDDVMTTGASMQALAQSVKQAGARDISALVLARTLKTH